MANAQNTGVFLREPNGKVTTQIVSSLALEVMPDIYKFMVENFPEDYSLELFNVMGRAASFIPTTNERYNWKESVRLHPELKVLSSAIQVVGGNNRLVLTLDGASVEEFQNLAGQKFAGTQRKNFINFPGMMALSGYVESAEPDGGGNFLIVVSNYDGTPLVNLKAAVDAGGYVISPYNHHPEGEEAQPGYIVDGKEYENQIHSIDHSFAFTDESIALEGWIEHTFLNEGKKGRVAVYRQERNNYVLFNQKIMAAVLLSRRNAPGAVDEEGNRIVTTHGYIPTLLDAGQVLGYTDGFFDMSDYYSFVERIRAVSGDSEYMFMYGLKLGANLERNFNEAFRNGAITYGSFSGKSVEEQKNKAVSLGFKSIELNGYTFHNKHLTLFSHPKLLGQKGFEYTKWGLLIPNLTGVMYDGSSNSTPYNAFCIRHYDLTKQGMYKGAAGDVTPVKASWVVQPGSGGTNKTKSQRNYVAHVGSEAKGIVKTFVVQPN